MGYLSYIILLAEYWSKSIFNLEQFNFFVIYCSNLEYFPIYLEKHHRKDVKRILGAPSISKHYSVLIMYGLS